MPRNAARSVDYAAGTSLPVDPFTWIVFDHVEGDGDGGPRLCLIHDDVEVLRLDPRAMAHQIHLDPSNANEAHARLLFDPGPGEAGLEVALRQIDRPGVVASWLGAGGFASAAERFDVQVARRSTASLRAHLAVDDRPIVHRRTMAFTSRDAGERLIMEAEIQDRRHRPDDTSWSMHRMQLHLEIRLSDHTITAAHTTMHDVPHAECVAAEQASDRMVGLAVSRGFTRAVRERIGGVAGCDHVAHLFTAVAPATVQALGGLRSRRAQAGAGPGVPADDRWWLRLRNSCHIWADGGVGEQKVAIGWSPSSTPTEYPTPPLAEIRRRLPPDR